MSLGADSNIFEINLAALAALLPAGEAERLRNIVPTEELELAATPSGYPTCRAFGLWIYSRHNPMKEALRLIEGEIPRSPELCVFENFGLGYHVEAFLRARPGAKAIVIEPDLRWFRAALAARDFTSLFSSKRVTFLLDASAELLPGLLSETPQAQVVRLRSLAGKDAEYFRVVAEEIRSVASREEINRNTLIRFGKRWVRNLIGNIALIADSWGVQELEGEFTGLPALVLAAGPSLDHVLPHLRDLRERLLIVCVDTSYRAALSVGVIPDFLVVVDPQYWNARHLDGCPIESTILVSESSTYPSVFHRRLGPLVLCGSLFPLGQYLERSVGEKGKLGAGGSVSTTTWDFARILGCAPLYCAGLDLGFPQGKTHFKGSFFEERSHEFARRTSPVETASFHYLRDADPYPIANNSGGLTLTDRRLVVYKWWFENQLKLHPEANTYTLSGEGARIEGMNRIEVGALLDLPVVRRQIDDRIQEVLGKQERTKGTTDREATLRRTVVTLIDELERLRHSGLQGLRAVDHLEARLQRDEDPNEVLATLETIDRRILRQTSRDIAGFLMHSTVRSILDPPEGGNDIEPTGAKAVQDSRELYRQLADAVSYHIRLLTKAVDRLSETGNSHQESC